MINSIYCLYRHIRLDKNEPFYIGIGTLDRPYSKHQRNRYWNYIVKKTDYNVEILLDGLTWEVACEKEKEFIKLYGRKDLGYGSLVNLTDGGDGTINHRHTQETKEKMKGRLSHNKGISKWDFLEEKVITLINQGYSENQIKDKLNITSGGIYRIKQKNYII
jgi:predicted GIY-YIG superfamily endonuclease